MKTMTRSIIVLLMSAAPALAAGAAEGEKGSGFLLILFLVFGALIIVFQLIPGLVLFVSMIRALFSGAPKDTPDVLPGRPAEK